MKLLSASEVVTSVGLKALPAAACDLSMFRQALLYLLDVGEHVDANKGYIGECPSKVKAPIMLYKSEPEYVAMKN